jgi:predicted acetyltransferase
MDLVLRTLTNRDEDAFIIGLNEWREDERHWYSFDYKAGSSFRDHVERLRKNAIGEDLPEGHVPSTLLYAFVSTGAIVGRISIRHRLNENLMFYGGNIGYSVAERYRRLGYGTQILREGIVVCRTIGIRRALLTVDRNNAASIKVIEKCRGKYQDTIWDDSKKRFTKRYWIDV